MRLAAPLPAGGRAMGGGVRWGRRPPATVCQHVPIELGATPELPRQRGGA